jgi:OOP family OmpA-OmpF porin
MIRLIVACAMLAALPAAAQDLEMPPGAANDLILPPGAAADLILPPGAAAVFAAESPMDSYALPLAPFDGTSVPARTIEGRIERRSWRLTGSPATSLQLLQPLRDQLRVQGYDIAFEFADRDCGGFDFRFATEVIEAPDMHVNLRDFRFLSATRGADAAVSVLVSVTRTASYVQTIRVAPPGDGG